MSNVRGIWCDSDLSEKFVRFFQLIQDEALSRDCMFFSWAGEGNEFFSDEMEGEDMSGWLVPLADVSEFEPQWAKDRSSIDEKFAEDICFAEWSSDPDGSVRIDFSFW